ncbi:uncharacterized protein HD556DRAFT_1251009 [Suillus plorans]|uniref:50S ribosomal protein L35 n=1 Tax=Suillus plorans TaxID=116603 RepID=A0A9P7AAK2_9AGAM|nr:uncharacterized protein HD556DRAFT_1251009 [Suillus plorans]KAG1784647.1 hypothetical protein HD556DRAFT_1251009 [Suillus plorans]
MFLSRLVMTAKQFSTSAVASFPKLKTHSGTKKRWRALSNGKFKRAHAAHAHLNVAKRPGRKNALCQTAYSSGAQTPTLKKLMPYA